MKICTKCQIPKPLEEFSKCARKGRQPWCKDCCKKRNRAYYHNDESGRKQDVRARAKNMLLENKAFVHAYLLGHPCVKCGEPDPVVLEFHHREPEDKFRCVSEMMGFSREKIAEEIAKCDVLCANCHKRVTAQQFGYLGHG